MKLRRALAVPFTLVPIVTYGCSPAQVDAPKASQAAAPDLGAHPEDSQILPPNEISRGETAEPRHISEQDSPAPLTTEPTTTQPRPTETTLPANSVARGPLPVSLNTPPEYVKQCESKGDYSAVNPSSGAGGAWQIIPSTWNGYGGYARAEDAPPEVQDAKAAQLWSGGLGASHWRACL